MKRLFSLSATLAAVAILTSACGGDATGTNSGDPLEAAEAEDLMDELVGIAIEGLFGGLSGSPSAQSPTGLHFAAAVPFDVEVSTSGPCEGGGTVSVSGSISGDVNQDNGSGTVEMDFTQSMSNCMVNTEGGKVFTVSSSPPIRMRGSFSLAEGQLSGTAQITYRGGFTYTANDGRSGSCSIDLTISFSQTSGSASGNVCGRSISVTGSVG